MSITLFRAFGDAHMSPQSASHPYGTAHTHPTIQIPEIHAHENLLGGLLDFSDSSRDFAGSACSPTVG